MFESFFCCVQFQIFWLMVKTLLCASGPAVRLFLCQVIMISLHCDVLLRDRVRDPCMWLPHTNEVLNKHGLSNRRNWRVDGVNIHDLNIGNFTLFGWQVSHLARWMCLRLVDVHDIFVMEQLPRFFSHIFSTCLTMNVFLLSCFRHAVVCQDWVTMRGSLLTLEVPIPRKLPSLFISMDASWGSVGAERG